VPEVVFIMFFYVYGINPLGFEVVATGIGEQPKTVEFSSKKKCEEALKILHGVGVGGVCVIK
jgi:hypothetical protein